jgi:hypothetical protein
MMLFLTGRPRRRLSETDIVLDGNSLFDYWDNPENSSSYAALGDPARTKQNFGVGGQTTAQMITDAVAQIDSIYTPGKVLLVWELRNHLYFGESVAGCVAAMRNYCLARKARGWQIIVLGTTPASGATGGYSSPALGTPAQFNSRLLEIDAAISAGYREYADGYIAVRQISGLGDSTNSAIFYDGVHLTNQGYALLAPVLNRAIRRLKRPRVQPPSVIEDILDGAYTQSSVYPGGQATTANMTDLAASGSAATGWAGTNADAQAWIACAHTSATLTGVKIQGGNPSAWGPISTYLNGAQVQTLTGSTWTTRATISGLTDDGSIYPVEFPAPVPGGTGVRLFKAGSYLGTALLVPQRLA